MSRRFHFIPHLFQMDTQTPARPVHSEMEVQTAPALEPEGTSVPGSAPGSNTSLTRKFTNEDFDVGLAAIATAGDLTFEKVVADVRCGDMDTLKELLKVRAVCRIFCVESFFSVVGKEPKDFDWSNPPSQVRDRNAALEKRMEDMAKRGTLSDLVPASGSSDLRLFDAQLSTSNLRSRTQQELDLRNAELDAANKKLVTAQTDKRDSIFIIFWCFWRVRAPPFSG